MTKHPSLAVVTALPLLMLAIVAGCGTSGAGSDLPAAAGNRAPTLTGAPARAVVPNTVYSFRPQAGDPDGDLLTFTVEALPGWATFDARTGAIRGVPGVGDVGTYRGITITAADALAVARLGPFDIEVSAAATGAKSLSWLPPTESADGSALTDLAGYRIRWGTQAGDHPNLVEIDTPGISGAVVDNLPAGTYFFVVSAYDESNNESASSNEVSGVVL